MARKKPEGVDEAESLLPSVKEEEARLKAALDAARAEAERSALEAERESAERVRSTRESLTSKFDEKRAAALRAIQSEADAQRKPAGEIEKKVEEAADAHMGAAVKLILARVLPGSST